MHGRDVGVTLEVLRVQRQQVSEAVNAHGGHQACIMYLHAGHGVNENKAAPLAARGQAAQTAWDCRGAAPGTGKSLATYKESYA